MFLSPSILFWLTVSLNNSPKGQRHISSHFLSSFPWHIISFQSWLVIPEEEGTRFLQSVGTSLPNYTIIYLKDRKFQSPLIFTRLTFTFMAKHGVEV